MVETPGEAGTPASRSARVDRRAFRMGGVVAVLLGLLLVLGGVALGFLEYDSPLERIEREGRAVLTQSLNGAQLEGGGQISVESHRPPGPAAYVIGEPATWLGALLCLAGAWLFIHSFLPDPVPVWERVAPEPNAVDAASPPDDEPFDTGDN